MHFMGVRCGDTDLGGNPRSVSKSNSKTDFWMFGGLHLKTYVPRRVRRRRQIMTRLFVGLILAGLGASVIVMRYPWIIPGATDFMDQARVYRDLATLPLTVKISVEDAVFWGPNLFIVSIGIENNSRFAILCKDLRLVDRQGQVYMPSSTSVYYVNRDESLWMRQVNPGQKLKGKYAFTVPDGVFGLMFAVDTEIGLVKLKAISEVARAY